MSVHISILPENKSLCFCCRFTHDEGGKWYKKQISNSNVTVYGLITEPGEITSVINVYAMEENGMEWVIFTIDFKEFLGKT